MTDDEATIRDLLAWAKDKSPGVRGMAEILAEQLQLQREHPDSAVLREVIAATVEHLKAKIDGK